MNFCSNCGTKTVSEIPAGDNRLRDLCPQCGTIHYENPKIIAGCLPVYEDKVLLCKRAIEPRLGYWTLPAGFMENGEATDEGALRETLEETNCHVEVEKLYAITSIRHVNHVQFIYLAHMPEPIFSATAESLDVRLFSEDEIPWDELAFLTNTNVLRHYFEDRKAGKFQTRELVMQKDQNAQVSITTRRLIN